LLGTPVGNLLIVDDVVEYLASLERSLRSEWAVAGARSLREAQEVLARSAPDVALVDIRLSETDPMNRDGVLVLEEIRTRYPHVPVVMMSAYRDFDAAVESLNLGSAHFLKKPIDLRELKRLLRSLTSPSSGVDSEEVR
jgi:DNA-binding NtrC family response regulator